MIRAEKITVIIPAYNAEKYLAEAIGSIKRQTLGQDAKIIVIDDGSTDRTGAIASESGVRLISRNHGYAAAARNAGIREADTPWLYFLDADDIAEDDALELLAKAVEQEDGTDAVFSMARDFVSPELPEKEKAGLEARKNPYPGAFGGAVFVKRSVFDQIGLLDETLTSGEGIEWLLRFRSSALKGLRISSVTVRRRLHLSNTGRVRKQDEGKNYIAILKRHMLERKQ